MPNVKTGKRREKMVILEMFKLGKDKNSIVLSLLFKDQTKKRVGAERAHSGYGF